VGDWDSIFKKKGKFFYKPAQEVKDFSKLLKKEKTKKILDLGSGSGRHTVFLTKGGFNVCGMDISGTGLSFTKEWLRKKNLKAGLVKSSCYNRFPFKDDFFDAIVSTQVIHHNYHEKVRFTISEIERVLKQGGLLLLIVPFRKNQKEMMKLKKRVKSKNVAPHTYVPIEGDEEGLPHFLYTKKLLIEDLKNFNIIDIHKTGGHYCFLGRLKN
jgi:SAM-dependent methyltransferase